MLPKRFSRRTFLYGLGAGGLGTVSYSRFVESRWLEHTRQHISLGLSKPIKILHLSDFHVSSAASLGLVESAIELGATDKPDIICLTGDFLTAGVCADFDAYVHTLARLSEMAPAYACLGNNDGKVSTDSKPFKDTQLIRRLLAASRVHLLANSFAELQINGSEIQIVGFEDRYSGEFNANLAFSGIGKSSPGVVIALCHNPDRVKELRPYPWNLLLCGHTHGGQVCIPFIGPPIVPLEDRTFVTGLYRTGNRWIYVNRGVGSWYGIRLNCRPEVTTLVLS